MPELRLGDLVWIDPKKCAYGYVGFHLRPVRREWGLVIDPPRRAEAMLHCEVLVDGTVIVLAERELEPVWGREQRESEENT
ncbi:MAG: hypothetical protein EBZ49_17460 [Proteobacteria bacterium]|nr:hypothetical protein [Pseudomonadota bacterium]